MSDKTHEQEMDTLRNDLALLREELAALVAGVKESARGHGKPPHAADGEEAPPQADECQSLWADLWHKLTASKDQSEKVVRDLSEQVEKHPLIGIVAAFGLGYLVAKLWYKESTR
jgi:ElaB/YqjD/DUF883 family membrane-anchored ribosome-binding protein